MIEVAIVGGGPAGAYCAYKLAENGIYPTIFDHSHPREKPCGGIISPLAQELFPFLKKLPIKHIKRTRMYLTSPLGRKVTVNIRRGQIICVSRLSFDQFILNKAMEKGAELLKEKVVDLEVKKGAWKIKTDKGYHYAKILVGADGINSIVRQRITKALNPEDKGVCYGYFVEGLEDEDIHFYFLAHRKGYLWVIPRKENTSVGVGCTEISNVKGLKRELENFIAKYYPYIKKLKRWAALVPNIKNVKTLSTSVSGKNWILIGDAAGHANPILGEGIPYAMLDGELAAYAILQNNPSSFDLLWRKAYGLNLLMDIKLRKYIYNKQILEFYCEYLKFCGILYY